MGVARARCVVLVGLTLASFAGGTNAASVAPAPPSSPEPTQSQNEADCMRVWGQARYTSGYEHIVHIDNGCSVAATCLVWTNVNPEPQMVAVPANESVAVVTFIGSPASVFVPYVRCTFPPPG